MPRYESENRIRKITLKNIYRNNTGKLVCGVWKLPEAEMLEQNQYHCSYYEVFYVHARINRMEYYYTHGRMVDF